MVRRGEITDRAWEHIESLLPRDGKRGGRWRDHRTTVVNGILWKLRTGSPWRDLARPAREIRSLGSPLGPRPDQVRRRGRRGVGGVSVDETGIRAHQHAAGARTKPSEEDEKGLLNPKDEAFGRSKGGFSTKLNLTCDGKGRPLSVVLAPGQRHGSTQLEGLLEAVRVARSEGRAGRLRKRPSLLADRGYSYERCRKLLRRRGITHTIPERKDQTERRSGRSGRRPGFDREAYRRRNVVERCVNKLKQWRGIATRYEKRAANYRAMVLIASLMMMWLPS